MKRFLLLLLTTLTLTGCSSKLPKNGNYICELNGITWAYQKNDDSLIFISPNDTVSTIDVSDAVVGEPFAAGKTLFFTNYAAFGENNRFFYGADADSVLKIVNSDNVKCEPFK